MDELIESIDKDIESHRKDGKGILEMIGMAATVLIVLLFISLAPEIALRLLPEKQLNSEVAEKRFEELKLEFKSKYNEEYFHVSEEEYKDLEVEGLLTEKIRDARRISKTYSGGGFWLDFLEVVSKLSIDNEKVNIIFKVMPILFSAIFAGCLLTYRSHMQAAKELMLKKIDLLSIRYESPLDKQNS